MSSKPNWGPVGSASLTWRNTDVYALGATLYRTAFGVRPVEALKRSGVIRQTKTDPLVPAREKGKGRFSDKCLCAIDAALQLEAGDRPQTTDAWLDIFGRPVDGEEAEGHASTHQSRQGWLKLLVAGVLILAIATGGYLWYDAQKGETTDDVPALLLRATTAFAGAPFNEKNLDEVRRIYLQILTQDRDNSQALTGYSAAILLKKFNKALEDEEQQSAVLLLNRVEAELKGAGIDLEALGPGWQRIELLNKLASLRQALPRAPLSAQNWSSLEPLIRDIAALPDGSSLADSANQGLQALKLTQALASNNQFTKAHEQLAIAEKRLSSVGIGSLVVAKTEIDKRETAFAAERRAKITALLHSAEKKLQEPPTYRRGHEQYLGYISRDP